MSKLIARLVAAHDKAARDDVGSYAWRKLQARNAREHAALHLEWACSLARGVAQGRTLEALAWRRNRDTSKTTHAHHLAMARKWRESAAYWEAQADLVRVDYRRDSRWWTVWHRGRVLGTVELPRIYDRSAPPYSLFDTSARLVGTAETRSGIKRVAQAFASAR